MTQCFYFPQEKGVTGEVWQGDPLADLWAVVARPPQEEICHQCPTSVWLQASSYLFYSFTVWALVAHIISFVYIKN